MISIFSTGTNRATVNVIPLLAAISDCAGVCLPVCVEGLDVISQRLSRADKSDIHIIGGIGFQGCDFLLIPKNLIAFFAIGTIRPGQFHGHGAAASSSKIADVIVD